MTLETVLLLVVYTFLVIGTFFGPNGLIGVINDSTPFLAAKIERDLTSDGFKRIPYQWAKPGTAGDEFY